MTVNVAENATVCRNCLLLSEQQSVQSKCKKWLENCASSKSASVSSEYATASSKSLECSQNQEHANLTINKNSFYSNLLDSLDEETSNAFKKKRSKFGNVNIYKSRKIHVGDITYITGPICLNQSFQVAKKGCTTNNIYLNEFFENAGTFKQTENGIVVHLSQTINVRTKSWYHTFSKCLFGFMEFCMKFVDGA